MIPKFNKIIGLYEQASPDSSVDVNAQSEYANTEPRNKHNKSTLHGFAITTKNIDGINRLLAGTIKEWKSETPVNIMGKDGTIGGTSELNGKAIYLMIRIANKSQRAANEV